MNWMGFLITLPVNIMIIFCMYLEIKKVIKKRDRENKSLKNLRSSDNIYINISEEEKEMLDSLTKFAGFKSNSQFIHSIIKEQDTSKIAL